MERCSTVVWTTTHTPARVASLPVTTSQSLEMFTLWIVCASMRLAVVEDHLDSGPYSTTLVTGYTVVQYVEVCCKIPRAVMTSCHDHDTVVVLSG